MVIRGKKTGKEQTVTAETWEQIVKNGDSYRWEVVSREPSRKENLKIPDELASADYSNIMRRALSAVKREDFRKALDLYQKAALIKQTKTVAAKIAELETFLSEEEE